LSEGKGGSLGLERLGGVHAHREGAGVGAGDRAAPTLPVPVESLDGLADAGAKRTDEMCALGGRKYNFRRAGRNGKRVECVEASHACEKKCKNSC
jgi:hypothetical protein